MLFVGSAVTEMAIVSNCRPIFPLERCDCGMPLVYSRLPEEYVDVMM